MDIALLEMRRVSVMRGVKIVLRDMDLQIGVGEHVAILGPNGCGKSTLIKTISRELYPLARPESSLKLLGQDRSGTFVITDTWRRRADGWRLWRRHSTPMTAGPMPTP